MILLKRKLSLFSTAILLSLGSVCATPDAGLPVSSLLESAGALLAAGEMNAALEHYDIAIKKDPSNYLTFFKRGAAYLSLGRSSKASEDFDVVLAFKPTFEAALLQRARLKAQLGDWEAARNDYNAAGTTKYSIHIDELGEAEQAIKDAQAAKERNDWDTCVEKAGIAIVVASGVTHLRVLRATCRMQRGDVHEAIGDYTHVAQLEPSSIEPHIKIANLLYYSVKDFDRATAQLRKCLRSDPDSKQCSKLLRRIKNTEKSVEKARNFVKNRQFNSANKILVGVSGDDSLINDVKEYIVVLTKEGYFNDLTPQNLLVELNEMMCEAFVGLKKPEQAKPYCEEALRLNPKSIPGTIFKADSLMDEELFEDAVNLLTTAKKEIDGAENDHRVVNKLKEATIALKQSKKKDYYKILRLTKRAKATKGEIKKAYRDLVLKFHPDKYHGSLTTEQIQTKMSDINEAYKTLMDPEKRAIVDQGHDPNDLENQGYQDGPFAGGFNGFDGFGGPQFVFKQGGAGGNPFAGGFKVQF